jgi:hypothetical protein
VEGSKERTGDEGEWVGGGRPRMLALVLFGANEGVARLYTCCSTTVYATPGFSTLRGAAGLNPTLSQATPSHVAPPSNHTPQYAVASALTILAEDSVTAVAWDSAGVTTGASSHRLSALRATRHWLPATPGLRKAGATCLAASTLAAPVGHARRLLLSARALASVLT